MAPAAKAIARGKSGAAARTPQQPNAPPIGSTAPLNWPQKKAWPAGMPSRRSGMDTCAHAEKNMGRRGGERE